MIEKRNGDMWISDLGSTNGTYVNGQRITQVHLSTGDVVQIGPFKLVYDAKMGGQLAPSVLHGHRLDTLNMGREVGGGKMILDRISMSIEPGEFVSLVGGSGAGKSTLLKALNGFNQANHGYMLLDGEELYPRLDLYRAQMGYVPQDDIIHMDLPVDKALYYSAKLRLPDASHSEIEARIHDALDQVDMTEHSKKKVKVLSGGQRKRVSIAVELLAQPTLFFLDEPTSGLDPGLEKKMMQDLNRLSDEGKTVVLVTHATANIEECDHVAFLSWGRLAYFGPPVEAPKFFQARDFADIYRRLSDEIDPHNPQSVPNELQPYLNLAPPPASPTNGNKIKAGPIWADYFQQSSIYKRYVTDRQQFLQSAAPSSGAQDAGMTRGRDSLLRQTWYLALRHFDLIRNNWMTLIVLLVLMPLIALLFMSVSGRYDLTGWPISPEQTDNVLRAELLCTEDEYEDIEDDLVNVSSVDYPPCVVERLETVEVPNREGGVDEVERVKRIYESEVTVDETADYIPTSQTDTLVTMLALAITQAGTFAASYEIVKERAIFKRERAVNLKVSSYLSSKIVVLGVFGIIQVVSVILIFAIKLELGFEGIFGPDGPWEMFITMFLAVMASILFGLFISAAVNNNDIVIYIILGQLFVQIILSGTMFPLGENNPVSRLTIANWTIDAMGTIADLETLNQVARACKIVSREVLPDEDNFLTLGCDEVEPRILPLAYEHTKDHLMLTWLGLLAHSFFWGILTAIILVRKKID
jgi:ABC-type multidrug transport system ATPase subunit